ncbi:MAG: alpha/beta fold hydrolase [Chloroflexi bacterium]|nr:alpha/beta fold hydrolase [Chloroflexota bacterium]
MNAPYCFVLIHSPLVGSYAWSLVAEDLTARGVDVRLPTLVDEDGVALPYWQRHAQSVVQHLAAYPCSTPGILVAHSGAGPLLPAISAALRASLGMRVSAYLFVDAGIPADALSRLDLMVLESSDQAAQFRQFLEAGGRFPDWSDEQLRAIVPDDAVRQRLLADLRPRALPFFSEPISVFTGWPDAPCGYIQLSPFYAGAYEQATRAGWAAAQVDAGHFHMLVNPREVAELMLSVVKRL